MQKIEIVLTGPEAEPCGEMIMGLAREAMKHFNVVPVRNYFGQDPVKKGYGELLIPQFMGVRILERKEADRMMIEGVRGDLISRNALMEAMSGIKLNTEEDVQAWIEAELLVEKARPVPDRSERFVRCDECIYYRHSKEGICWCCSAEGLGGDLYPEKGDGCSRGRFRIPCQDRHEEERRDE